MDKDLRRFAELTAYKGKFTKDSYDIFPKPNGKFGVRYKSDSGKYIEVKKEFTSKDAARRFING